MNNLYSYFFSYLVNKSISYSRFFNIYIQSSINISFCKTGKEYENCKILFKWLYC